MRGASFHCRVLITPVVLSLLSLAGVSTAASPNSNWAILRSEALTAYDSGDFGRAEQLLRSALSSLPNPASNEAAFLSNELGKVLQDQSRFDEAEQQYRRAIEINKA